MQVQASIPCRGLTSITHPDHPFFMALESGDERALLEIVEIHPFDPRQLLSRCVAFMESESRLSPKATYHVLSILRKMMMHVLITTPDLINSKTFLHLKHSLNLMKKSPAYGEYLIILELVKKEGDLSDCLNRICIEIEIAGLLHENDLPDSARVARRQKMTSKSFQMILDSISHKLNDRFMPKSALKLDEERKTSEIKRKMSFFDVLPSKRVLGGVHGSVEKQDDPLQFTAERFTDSDVIHLELEYIRQDPSNSTAYVRLGSILPKNGRVRLLDDTEMTKRDLFKKAIHLDATNASTYVMLGMTLPQGGTTRLLNGTIMNQQDLFLRAIQLNPLGARAYLELGYSVSHGGRISLLDGTVMTQQDLFMKAIQQDPYLAEAYSALRAILPFGGKAMEPV